MYVLLYIHKILQGSSLIPRTRKDELNRTFSPCVWSTDTRTEPHHSVYGVVVQLHAHGREELDRDASPSAGPAFPPAGAAGLHGLTGCPPQQWVPLRDVGSLRAGAAISVIVISRTDGPGNPVRRLPGEIPVNSRIVVS